MSRMYSAVEASNALMLYSERKFRGDEKDANELLYSLLVEMLQWNVEVTGKVLDFLDLI